MEVCALFVCLSFPSHNNMMQMGSGHVKGSANWCSFCYKILLIWRLGGRNKSRLLMMRLFLEFPHFCDFHLPPKLIMKQKRIMEKRTSLKLLLPQVSSAGRWYLKSWYCSLLPIITRLGFCFLSWFFLPLCLLMLVIYEFRHLQCNKVLGVIVRIDNEFDECLEDLLKQSDMIMLILNWWLDANGGVLFLGSF